MRRYCLTLDLRADEGLIREYVAYHREGWPAVHQSIRAAGVVDMQIYALGERLFMIMEVDDDFSFERKAAMDRANPVVQEWEALMARFQDVAADGDPSAKWRVMEKIFQLR